MTVDLNAPRQIFPDVDSNGGIAAMAMISEEEFAWAQIVIPDLTSYFDFQDWLDRREGFQIGLSMAGVDVRTVSIVLSPFLAWCRLTETAPSERSLDAFASMIMVLREPPAPSVLAVVREGDFEVRSGEVAALAAHTDFDRWTRHRETVRARLARGGARVEELIIRLDDFIEWGSCLGEGTTETTLDTYAGLLLEYLATDHLK
jgi:hypothetical protein